MAALVRIAATVVATALALTALPARADDALDKAAAEVAFREGMSLLAAGNVAEACPKLESAVALTRGEALGGKLELARCYEKSGRLASAWGLFLEVASRARASTQEARATEASSAAAAIEPRVPRVRITLGGEVAAARDVTVERDGKAVPSAAWTSWPTDPGEVALVAKSGGRQARKVIVAGEGSRLAVHFDRFDVASAAPSPVVPVASPAADDRDADDRDVGTGDGQRWVGIALGGTGVVTFGASVVMGVVASGNYDDAFATQRCAEVAGALQCDDASALDGPRGLGTAATVVGGVGLGLVAAGLITYFTAPSAAATGIALKLDIGPGTAVAGLGGTFR